MTLTLCEYSGLPERLKKVNFEHEYKIAIISETASDKVKQSQFVTPAGLL